MPWSTNATFLVELSLRGATTLAIYKPERGERPLWDFPSGLHRREVAAFLLSEALGWGIVPLTIARDGPFGAGSFQFFVDADFEQHFFSLVEEPGHHDRLKRICLFDLLTNNADRKSGHCLLGRDGLVYAIDHGLSFHVEPKLRTVIWAFGGEPVPADLLEDIQRLLQVGLPPALGALLDPGECKVLLARARAVLGAGHFPRDHGGHRHPWPLV